MRHARMGGWVEMVCVSCILLFVQYHHDTQSLARVELQVTFIVLYCLADHSNVPHIGFTWSFYAAAAFPVSSPGKRGC